VLWGLGFEIRGARRGFRISGFWVKGLGYGV